MFYSRGLAAPSTVAPTAEPLVIPGMTGVKPIVLDTPRAYHLPGWATMSDPQRIRVLRGIAVQRGRDPRLRQLAFTILRNAGVDERQYEKQAAALLKWVQDSIAYVNEPGEQLQDPLLTLRVQAGDCDDKAMLLATLYEAIRLPWRYVLSGSGPANAPGVKPSRIRWVEGTPLPRGFRAGHIYVRVGWPPFMPPDKVTWGWAEPTIKGKPLGWDVTGEMERRGTNVLPELAGAATPASAGVAAATIAAAPGSTWRQVGLAIIVGTSVALGSQLLMRWLEHHRIVPANK